MNCSIAQCLEVVGEWWSLLIVRDASRGITRFADLEADLGISRNVLNQRLGSLVDQGILERVPYQDHPPRFDYQLTEKGRDLFGVLTMMRQWGDRWAAPRGAPIEVVHDNCGQVSDAVLTCSACGERIEPDAVHPIPGPGAVKSGMNRAANGSRRERGTRRGGEAEIVAPAAGTRRRLGGARRSRPSREPSTVRARKNSAGPSPDA